MRRKGAGRFSVRLALPSEEPAKDPAGADRQRIDRWLWHARLVRTRSAAAALAAAGYVRINGTRIDAPGRMVRLGDVITVALDHAVRVLKVRGFAERRGPPSCGPELYEELGRGDSARRRNPHDGFPGFCEVRRIAASKPPNLARAGAMR